MGLLSPKGLLRTLRDDRRTLGWRGLFRRHGWKPVVAFLAFYLIRDIILYILIPLAIYAGIAK
jgi:hypothetical protein